MAEAVVVAPPPADAPAEVAAAGGGEGAVVQQQQQQQQPAEANVRPGGNEQPAPVQQADGQQQENQPQAQQQQQANQPAALAIIAVAAAADVAIERRLIRLNERMSMDQLVKRMKDSLGRMPRLDEVLAVCNRLIEVSIDKLAQADQQRQEMQRP